jgi:hypothetical protein
MMLKTTDFDCTVHTFNAELPLKGGNKYFTGSLLLG